MDLHIALLFYDTILLFVLSDLLLFFFPASNFLKVSYDNAKACAVVETTDVSPNLIDVDQKNRQIPTENARNKNIYDSNSKQINLPGLSIDSPYHSEDSAGKFNRLFFLLQVLKSKKFEFIHPFCFQSILN